MQSKKTKIIVAISFFIFFSAIFYDCLSVKLWDYDFWWHISSGRYISETGSLPDKEPFSFTSEMEENSNLFPVRESFILKQYWLSQVMFYLTYKTFGATGIIIFRSLIIVLIIFSVFWGLKRNNVSFYMSFMFVFLAYYTAMTYTGERPVLFTILFSVLVFLILDGFRSNRHRTIFLLIPVMLLWANLHGGFIIGVILIMVYMGSEGLKIIFRKTEYTKKNMVIFYAVTIIALAASYVNPTGWDAFYIVLSPEYKPLELGIHEYLSPLTIYKNKLSSIDYAYVTLAFLFPLILILRNKKIDLTHFIVLSGLFFMSIGALRYIIYYVIIGAIILGTEMNVVFEKLLEKGFFRLKKKWLKSIFAVFIVFSLLAFFSGFLDFDGLTMGEATRNSVPEMAVDFIEKNRLPGNMYSDPGFGGYVTWRLYPWKKNFTDTRWINPTVAMEARWIVSAKESIRTSKLPEGKTPLWERLIDHYNVDIILLNTLDVVGTVPPLVLELIEHEEWIPVHSDLISVIFVRDIENNREVINNFRISNESTYNTVIARITQWAMLNEENPRYLISLGNIFYRMGRKKEALTAYEYANSRLPGLSIVQQKIQQVKSELTKENMDERP